MTLSKNRVLFVMSTHDCGKAIINGCLKNNPDIFLIDYIGALFRDYKNDLTKILEASDLNLNLDQLINLISPDLYKDKNILLLSWHPYKRILNRFKNIFPIFLFRDVRVAWLVSEHKKEGSSKFYNISIDNYINLFNKLLEDYLDIIKTHNVLIYKFEFFLTNKNDAYNKLCNDLNITHDYRHIPTFFKEKSELLSMFDIEKIIKFQKYVNDDQLSYISSKTKDYNKFFDYPDNLSKEDILKGLKI